jgi:hypothetical protein
MINAWFIIPVFTVGYFLGWRRGEFVGQEKGRGQAKVVVDKALKEYRLEQLKGSKSEQD